MTDDGIDLPEDVWLPFESPNSHLQLMFPIALGGVWEYPMAEVRPTIEEFPLERAQEAYDRMMANEARFRAVLKIA